MVIESAQGGRNILIGQAVRRALSRVDDFIAGAALTLPTSHHRRVVEQFLETHRPSVKTAMLCLLFYWLEDPAWDMDSIPVGIRGKYGDKLLSQELTQRNITLHGAITAFGENLGWKGNVRNFRLSTDPRFQSVLGQIADADLDERHRIADFLAQKFAESRRVSAPLPPVGAETLTFARAKILLYDLVALPSEGHIQQFMIAALLYEFRRRYGSVIVTHHPHAADRFDRTAGDIEERRDGTLVRAYEVTMRDDWQNRISTYVHKMDIFELRKYTIIAADINKDTKWSVPAKMALTLEGFEHDIAVIDIYDVINFLSAELTATELRNAINKIFEYLSNPALSGREDFMRKFREAVGTWLDQLDNNHQI